MFLQKPMLGTQIDRSDSLNDPVLDLLFNEGHGNIVHDLSGWGNHGTLHGFDFPPTRTSGWGLGVDGVALNFDGVDDYIDCGNGPSLRSALSYNFGIGLCVKPFSAPDNMSELVWKYPPGFLLRFNSKRKVNLYTVDVNTNPENHFSTKKLPLNEWTYLFVNRNYDNERVEFYFNGKKDVFVTDSTGDLTNMNTLYITRAYNFQYFDGAIARARILPRAMSAFEVMQRQIDPYGVYQQ